jgi:hypothetical protein
MVPGSNKYTKQFKEMSAEELNKRFEKSLSAKTQQLHVCL